MRKLPYLHVDVFTDRPFAGNPLAVLPAAHGLHDAEMQAIAREFNFSETTFILPAEIPGTDARMRIFTPEIEIPMAGHPTVGSTFALAWTGVIAPGTKSFTFGLGIGPTTVTLDWRAGKPDFAWMRQPVPEAGVTIADAAALAAALGLPPAALAEGTPAQEWSAGVPFLFVPLRSRLDVDTAILHRPRLQRLLQEAGAGELPVFIFSTDAGTDEHHVYSRMFAPSFGVPEDPATGAASGPLGAFLLHHDLIATEPKIELTSLQGQKMGRPGLVHVRLQTRQGRLECVEVGGRATLIGSGELQLPDPSS